MNYYIADLHFGHSGIIGLCNRPFNNADDMDETMIANWNSKVSNNDTVYILGDFSYKSRTNPVDILKRLNGKKILIEGNHDEHNLKNMVFRKCFQEICQIKTIYDNGVQIQLCHYPIVEWDGYYSGGYLIFGHIHNNTQSRAYKAMKIEDKALNAGAELIDYTPATFQELIEANKEFKRLNEITDENTDECYL